MSRTTTSLLLLALPILGCQGPETGLDHSVVTGTISIPPVAVAEIEDAVDADNDDTLNPQYVGPDGSAGLSYRAVVVSGTAGEFGELAQNGGPREPDNYGFAPAADGEFTFWLQYQTGAATRGSYTENTVFQVDVFDLDAGGVSILSAPESTDGSGGAWSLTVPVEKGVNYAILVWGENAEDVDSAPYTLVLSGSTPGPDTILVGAYLEGDPAVASAPVGGTTVPEWTFDMTTWTWSGAYEALFMRTVVNVEQDTGEGAVPANPTINEGVGSVFMMAGTLGDLNKSPSAGSLYTTTSVEVALNAASVAVPEPLVLDGIFPRVIGVEIAEIEPDTTFAALDADYNLAMDTLVAQDIGQLTGPGYVDIVEGVIALTGSDGWEANDSDAFGFTITEPGYAGVTASFDDPSGTADLDFMIFGDDGAGTYFDYMYFDCANVYNPEQGTLYVPTAPDMTYYLVALGYAGSGDVPYHIEIEWTAP